MVKAILHTIVGILLSYIVKYPNTSGIIIVSMIYVIASVIMYFTFN